MDNIKDVSNYEAICGKRRELFEKNFEYLGKLFMKSYLANEHEKLRIADNEMEIAVHSYAIQMIMYINRDWSDIALNASIRTDIMMSDGYDHNN